MQLHKRNSNLIQTTTAEGVDSRIMGNFFLVVWILASFTTSSTIFNTIDKLDPLQLNQPPYSYMCYFRSLVNGPQIAFGLFVILFFNRDYIESIMDEVSNLKKHCNKAPHTNKHFYYLVTHFCVWSKKYFCVLFK